MPDTEPTESTDANNNAGLDASDVASILLARDTELETEDRGSRETPIEEPLADAADDDAPLGIAIPVDGEDPAGDDKKTEDAKPEKGQWPDSAKARVDKLTAQKSELTAEKERLAEEVAQLRANLEQAVRVQPKARDADPQGDVVNFEQLEQRRDAARQALDWLIQNPYGGEVPDGKGGTRVLTADDVQERRTNVERVLQVQLPARERWLAEASKANQETITVYPDLFKPGPQSDAAFRVLHRLPELANHPDHVRVVGDILVGEAVRSGKYVLVPKGERKQPAPSATPLPQAPSSATSQPVPAGTARASDNSMKQFLATGDPHDLSRVLEQRM